MRNKKGFTLIELMIVVAIIGILAAIAIPMYKTQTVKARMSEGIRALNTVASAVGDYYNEAGAFPPALGNAGAISNTLGSSVVTTADDAEAKMSAISVAANTGAISITFANCGDADVDGDTLVMTPTTTANGGIYWTYSSTTIPAKFMPKK
jgi:type IV pilus assembly protein PilA